jgi:SAM-dependent methyltransferase
MLSVSSKSSGNPDWFTELVGDLADEGFVVRDGILRQERLLSESQAQTSDAFGFKWAKRDTFESDASLSRMRDWLRERYGAIEEAVWLDEHGDQPVLLDAGCGAGMSGLLLFEPVLDRLRYIGADVSAAVDVARSRFTERGADGAFIQADLTSLPFAEGSIDLIFSEGVLHHTDSTEGALKSVVPLLRPGGRILFYVYRRKGPIREFTDDYVRERLAELPPEDAWEAVAPLTELGRILGELELTIDIPRDIELLDIPAGEIDIQRLFYWHVIKAYHDPSLTFDELNHINFDWFAPRNAHRQSPEEVRRWCEEAGLEIERERVEPAGITVVARKRS